MSPSTPPPRRDHPTDEMRRLAALAAYELLDSEPEQAYDDIVRLAVTLCAVPAATISLVDHDRYWYKAALGIRVAQTPRSQALCDVAMRTPRQLMLVEDTLADARSAHLDMAIDGRPVRFYAGMPLCSPDGHALGTLNVLDVEPRRLSADQRQALELLARQTQHLFELRRYTREQGRLLAEREAATRRLQASRDDLQRRHERLKHSAARDPLTGLLNRAALGELRESPDALARLDAGPYSLMLIDVDHFKQVNDRHGHLLGDRALRAVADSVAASVRAGDVAVRFGGEEILVILPQTRLAHAAEVAGRVRQEVAGVALPFPLTVSIGIAGGEPAHDEPEAVFERADQALYRAKAAGRDRVVVDDTPQLG